MPEWILYLALPAAVLLGVGVVMFYIAADGAPIYDNVDVPGSKDQPDPKPYDRDGPRQAGDKAHNDDDQRPAGGA